MVDFADYTMIVRENSVKSMDFAGYPCISCGIHSFYRLFASYHGIICEKSRCKVSDGQIIGRKKELKVLEELLQSPRAEFLAVYGRRRVGKTYLISEFFKDKGTYFELTGIKNASKSEQLKNFSVEFGDRFFKRKRPNPPKDWTEAFTMLRHELDQFKEEKILLFFDELPWLASPKSGFLQALDHLWNRYLSRDKRVILIVCGSAASWMIKKVINNKGGLYGRLTRQIQLLPYNLKETKEFLFSRGIHLDHKQIIELYMAIGGIPKYLDYVPRGKSAAQAIQDICFNPQHAMANEFHRLYDSLFDNSQVHIKVTTLLAKNAQGLTKQEIIDKVDELTSGGGSTELLDELEKSAFIRFVPQFKHKKKAGRYLLIDEFSLFYLNWMHPLSTGQLNQQQWMRMTQSPKYKTWAGYAFEALCLKHTEQIIRGLGLTVVASSYSGWRSTSLEKESKGAQIDLIIEREDRCINLCEIKFYKDTFTITKDYAENLNHKRLLFSRQTGTNYTLFNTLITTYGAKENEHYRSCIDTQLVMDEFFH